MGDRSIYYACDPTIDPNLSKSQNKKGKLQNTSQTPKSLTPEATLQKTQSLPATEVKGTRLSGALEAIEESERQVSSSESKSLLELETSMLFEWKDVKHGDVHYCMKCGPFIVRRRRRDSLFYLPPVR